MKVMVTGAGGFIGGHLVERLVDDGDEVVALDRKPCCEWCTPKPSSVWKVKKNVLDLRMPDLRTTYYDPTDVEPVEKVEVIYHLAAESRIQPSFDDPLEFVWSNMAGTASVLDWARRTGASVVYAGSSTADDDVKKNVYALTKWQGEQLCETYNRCFNVRTSITRFYNVYGPRQIEDGQYATVIGIFEKQFREGKRLTVTGDGCQRRDFTHVDDIVNGLVQVGRRGSNNTSSSSQSSLGCPIFSFGSGINHSILEVARMFVGDEDDRIEFVPKRPGEAWITLADRMSNFSLEWEPERSNLLEYVSEVVKRTTPSELSKGKEE